VPPSARAIAYGAFENNCAKRVFVPPPEGMDTGAYHATVYFDCEKARADNL
jgi:hypothetical protein